MNDYLCKDLAKPILSILRNPFLYESRLLRPAAALVTRLVRLGPLDDVGGTTRNCLPSQFLPEVLSNAQSTALLPWLTPCSITQAGFGRRCSYKKILSVRAGPLTLKSFRWWPTMWEAQKGSSPTPPEISKDAVFKHARFSQEGLRLTAEHNGIVYTGIIARSRDLSEDFLILLRHILLQHWGERIEVVESFDLESNEYFRFVK